MAARFTSARSATARMTMLANRSARREHGGRRFIGQSVIRTIQVVAPADCVYPGASLQLQVDGPDFTFDDGTSVKTIGLDLAINATLNLKFAPTVEGGRRSRSCRSVRAGRRGRPGSCVRRCWGSGWASMSSQQGAGGRRERGDRSRMDRGC
jgi:hypothetical protein